MDKKPLIIPAILTEDFEVFKKQINQLGKSFPYAQIDVMDGEFVPGRSFSQVDQIEKTGIELPLELHLMVNDPVVEMRKWREIDNVFRVLFHLEAKTDILRSLSFAKKEGWEKGIVINPDTPLSDALPLLDKIDVLQFMTVNPGKQGAELQEKVINKIKKFKNEHNILVSVDGGINKKTINKFKGLEIDVFNVGSALTLAEYPAEAGKEILNELEK